MERTRKHSIENIIFLTLSAVICGAETWNDIEEFGKSRIDWLSRYLDMPNGIPSHDTLNRFFSSLDIEKFEECFRKWVSSIVKDVKGDVISIDGKSIRGCKISPTAALHMVSAWSNNAGITLGQVKTATKGSEVHAIPELLDALFLDGAIVTTDALGSTPVIAAKIVEKKADYVLQIKRNRFKLFPETDKAFKETNPHSTSTSTNSKDHGRVETRKVSVIHNPDFISKYPQWSHLKSVIRVETKITNKLSGSVEESSFYYVSSLETDAKHIGNAIRSHWGIENNLHWMLDVAFSEDRGKKRNENAVVNFSLINKIALEMLKKESTLKVGVKSKRMKAAWDLDYLERIIGVS